jgi:hypothetical protein
LKKKFKTKFWGLRQKLSIKSDKFTPPLIFKIFRVSPLARGTLVISVQKLSSIYVDGIEMKFIDFASIYYLSFLVAFTENNVFTY